MKFLIIHIGFPGQFEHIVKLLLSKGHSVHGVGLCTCNIAHENFSYSTYKIISTNTQGIFAAADEIETKIIRGASIKNHYENLKRDGLRPDICLIHPGWGEALYIKQVWESPLVITYQEFYYHLRGSDLDYDNPGISQANSGISEYRLELKNALALHSLALSDSCISPTKWQRSRFPSEFLPKISVFHDGINLKVISKILEVQSNTFSFKNLRDYKYISYAARCLEPYRGFHLFMRALPDIQRAYPWVNIVIIGAENKGSYGSKPKDYISWKKALLHELGESLDLSKIHFLDTLPYPDYIQVLSHSLVHTYLSYPFVLSWGFLVACSLGIPVVANRIKMIEEAAIHFENCSLIEEFSSYKLVSAISSILDNRIKRKRLYLPPIYDIHHVTGNLYEFILQQTVKS